MDSRIKIVVSPKFNFKLEQLECVFKVEKTYLVNSGQIPQFQMFFVEVERKCQNQ